MIEPAIAALKRTARQAILNQAVRITRISHDIHGQPELGYEEQFASARLRAELAELGYGVESGICNLPTAFRAYSGRGKFKVAICAEYDALPGMGHACGHNLIAAA